MLPALIFGPLFLVGRYESRRIPLPVIPSIAIAVLGGFIGLHLCGLSLSICARLGLVMLTGPAGKSAILMVWWSSPNRNVPPGNRSANPRWKGSSNATARC